MSSFNEGPFASSVRSTLQRGLIGAGYVFLAAMGLFFGAIAAYIAGIALGWIQVC